MFGQRKNCLQLSMESAFVIQLDVSFLPRYGLGVVYVEPTGTHITTWYSLRSTVTISPVRGRHSCTGLKRSYFDNQTSLLVGDE